MASSFSSPWPDPNSPVLSKIDFGISLVELFKWLDLRDTLLGENSMFRKQDIPAALTLAHDCKHPDAVWLTSLFEGKDVSTKEQAKKVFLSFENDARALCFAWCLTDDRQYDLMLLRRASGMGNAFACSMLSREVWGGNEEEAFRLARFAAAERERGGFFWLGRCFHYGYGCEKNLNSAIENFLLAAELGDKVAAGYCGDFKVHYDPACWLWWSRAALRGYPHSFFDNFSSKVEDFFCDSVEDFFFDSGKATIVFLIGRALKRSIEAEKKLIFGERHNFDLRIGPASQAVSFYFSQCRAARLAVDTWTLLSTRLHLIKDIRIFIGKLIWEARFEANYKI